MRSGLALALGAALLCSTEGASAATGAPLDMNGLVLRFEDTFDGGAIDPTKWHYLETFDVRWHEDSGQRQVYLLPGECGYNPYQVARGMLVIAAIKRTCPQWPSQAYLSGAIATTDRFEFQYGYMEARMQLPRGKGLWPAFWMVNQHGWPPEIDMLDLPTRLYHDTEYHAGIISEHEDHSGGGDMDVGTDVYDGFHTYGAEWGPQQIVFYFDRREVLRMPTPPDFHRPMNLILNLAVGGEWPGEPPADTTWPQTLVVDYVKVWQRAGRR